MGHLTVDRLRKQIIDMFGKQIQKFKDGAVITALSNNHCYSVHKGAIKPLFIVNINL